MSAVLPPHGHAAGHDHAHGDNNAAAGRNDKHSVDDQRGPSSTDVSTASSDGSPPSPRATHSASTREYGDRDAIARGKGARGREQMNECHTRN